MSQLTKHRGITHDYHGIQKANRREFVLLLLAAGFVFTNAIALSLAMEGQVKWQHLYAPAVWLCLISLVYWLINRFLPGHDMYLLPIVAFLSGWGLILLDRLAPGFLWRQVIWLTLGMAAMVTVAVLPRNLSFLRRYRYTWLILGILLLGATLIFGVNPSGYGATLWLKIPLIGRVFFQPSELLKLLLIVFLASFLDDQAQMVGLRQSMGQANRFVYIFPLFIMWGLCLVLLVWQRDLGVATLFLIVFLALLYLATGDWRYSAAGMGLLVVAGIAGYFFYGVVELRIDTWWNPWPEASGRGFQIVQSLYAVAAGSLVGQGVAQGSPTFIPVVHSDFAFAAITEEWGLVGGLVAIGCFGLICYRGMRIASLGSRPFRTYMAAGISVVFFVQALLIMSGVTKLLPLTGVTLPFVSYGGSSLLMSCIMVGLLLNLSVPRMNHPASDKRTLLSIG
jgi:cell division protein FtsW (lipid II flippase)